jgi:DNA polymerase elongation subunit (family B)
LLKKVVGIGRKYVKNDRDWTMELKGVETKRRNYCAALKETLLEVFNIFLREDKTSGSYLSERQRMDDAVAYVRTQLTDLLEGKVPMEKLLISTKLNTTYKQENLPGLNLVKRMRERKDFHTPEVGARFQFLYVYDKKNAPKEQYKRSEDIHFAQTNGLEPDIVYYMEKQFKNPILGFLGVLGASKAERLFVEMISKAEAARAGNQGITNFFKSKQTVPTTTLTVVTNGVGQIDSDALPNRKRKLVQQKLGFAEKKSCLS